MEDLALHVMDIMENSIRAGATRIEVDLRADRTRDRLVVRIRDDGAGMDARTRRRARDPFFTTRGGKRVGLGLALLAQAARESGGALRIRSAPGRGTVILAGFGLSHPDRKPLGDVEGTVAMLRAVHPGVDFACRIRCQGVEP